MFGLGSSQNSHCVIAVYDHMIQYLLVTKDTHGLFVKAYGTELLEEGIISKGEILRAQSLSEIITRIQKEVLHRVEKKTAVTVLLDARYTLDYVLDADDTKKESINDDTIHEYIASHELLASDIDQYHYRYTFNNQGQISLHLIQKERYQSYYHLFTSLGFTKVTVQGDTCSLSHILTNTHDQQFIFLVRDNYSLVMEYSNGVLQKRNMFEYSYKALTSIIMKELDISNTDAQTILSRYGVSRDHREEKIYQRMVRLMTPVLDFLRKKPAIHTKEIHTYYTQTPLVGLEDMIHGRISANIAMVDPQKAGDTRFHDVLILPKKDMFQYSLLMVAAQGRL